MLGVTGAVPGKGCLGKRHWRGKAAGLGLTPSHSMARNILIIKSCKEKVVGWGCGLVVIHCKV